MEQIEINEVDELSLPQPSKIVAVAINGNRKSKHLIKWALDNFAAEEKTIFKLLHVHPRTTTVPTPMGNFIPISQVRDDVADAYKKEVEWKTSEMLLPNKRMFLQKKVQVDVVNIESDDVATAIAKEVAKGTINKLVIGASSRGMFTRKSQNLSSKISECTPSFCTVYAVSNGKLSSARPSDSETNWNTIDENSDTSSTYSSSS